MIVDFYMTAEEFGENSIPRGEKDILIYREKIKSGVRLYQVEDKTGDVKEFEDYVDTPLYKMLDNFKRVDIKSGFTYVTAINKKNALRKFRNSLKDE